MERLVVCRKKTNIGLLIFASALLLLGFAIPLMMYPEARIIAIILIVISVLLIVLGIVMVIRAKKYGAYNEEAVLVIDEDGIRGYSRGSARSFYPWSDIEAIEGHNDALFITETPIVPGHLTLTMKDSSLEAAGWNKNERLYIAGTNISMKKLVTAACNNLLEYNSGDHTAGKR
ncbi:MAG: hypothetical protein IJM62_01200 [Lachnospiraceae bacterium]|nr:hypothetical protein [Lachnospiraceae bacterium]